MQLDFWAGSRKIVPVQNILGPVKGQGISPAVSHFHGTEFDILAGFGPVGSTEK